MIRHSARVAGIVFVVLVASATAQQGRYLSVENPFQDGFDFEVNSTLEPMVEIAGVRWTQFGLHTKGEREIDPGKEIPVTVKLGFVNTNSESVRVLVIALLEDSAGNTLHRVECSRFGANPDRLKESTQKFKISGLALQSASRVDRVGESEE